MRRRVQGISAFTLIEILSVIVIMSIIAALLVMAARGARQKADADAAKAGVTFVDAKIHAYIAKRGQLPPDIDGNGITTEDEIYQTLAEWDLAVPRERQVDPWGRPFIIILQRDYTKIFPIDGSGPPYNGTTPYGERVNVQAFTLVRGMYRPAILAQAPKEIHEGDPAALPTPPAYLNEANSFQVICAGPDGLLSRDNREATGDFDGDGLSVNADNFTNW